MKRSSPGQILIISLLFLLILMTLAGVLVTAIMVNTQQGRFAYAQAQALQLAEAGIDKALYEFNKNPSYTGESGTALSPGYFTATITNVGNTKVVESSGFVPNESQPLAKKTVRVELNTTTWGASFVYGVQVDYGGLVMGNNAVVSGSVYSNGSIAGSNNAAITGDAWVAGGVNPAPDQEQALQTGQQNVGDTSSRADAAQSFQPGVSQVLSRVSLYIERTGNPANATVRIVPDNAGNPSGTQLASGTLNSASVGTSFGWVDVSMSAPPALIAGNKYWIVIDMPSVSATRYYTLGKHDNSGYGNGEGKYSNNWAASPAVWNSADGDFGFRTYMGGGDTQIQGVDVGFDAHAHTISNVNVGKDAYYQTISGSSVGGAAYPGSADPSTLDMPLSGSVIADFKNAAASGGTITPSGGTYLISGVSATLGPKKIAGDLYITNGAVVTITGPVWVEGDITVENNSLVKLDAAFGSDSTMVIADYPSNPYSKGRIFIFNNGQLSGSGQPDSYLMLLSTYADTVNSAIDISNNTTGAIFYTTAGIINVSNNVSVKEAIAYKLNLSNNASIVYESGLANVHFSAGPMGGWAIRRGSWMMVGE